MMFFKKNAESYANPPFALRFRSSTFYIGSTIFLAILVDLAAYGLVVPVIPFRLRDLGYPEEEVGALTGWLVASYAAGLIVATPFAAVVGALVKSRRNPLLFSLLFMAGATVLFMESNNYLQLIVARVLQGISGTFVWVLSLALITDSCPVDRLGVVLGYVLIGMSVGQLIGPLAGGVLYQRYGFKAPFIFALVLIALDFALRLMVIEKYTALLYINAGTKIPGFEAPGYVEASDEESTTDTETIVAPDMPTDKSAEKPTGDTDPQSTPPKKGFFSAGFATGSHALATLLTSPRTLTLMYVTLLNGFVVGALLDTGMTLYLNERYGLNAEGAGLTFIAIVAPAFIASPISGKLSDVYTAKYPVLGGVFFSIFPTYIVLALPVLPLPAFIVMLVLLGFSLSFFVTPVVADLSMVASGIEGSSAYVFSIFNLMYSVGTFIGPIVGGQVIAQTGVATAWWVLSTICAATALIGCLPIWLYVGGDRKKAVVAEESE